MFIAIYLFLILLFVYCLLRLSFAIICAAFRLLWVMLTTPCFTVPCAVIILGFILLR